MRLTNENRRVKEPLNAAASLPRGHSGQTGARRRHLVAQFVLVAVIIGTLLTIFALAQIQHWPRRYNPPDMDLSRRAVFVLASTLELCGAGIIGFAFGLTAANRRPTWPRPATMPVRSSSTRVVVMIICGLFLIIVAGHYEYLALTDKLP